MVPSKCNRLTVECNLYPRLLCICSDNPVEQLLRHSFCIDGYKTWPSLNIKIFDIIYGILNGHIWATVIDIGALKEIHSMAFEYCIDHRNIVPFIFIFQRPLMHDLPVGSTSYS